MTTGTSSADPSSAPDIANLCFAARALAQTHPMSQTALRYRQQMNEAERQRQPVTEPADWAAAALLVGYCLRRIEEQVFHDRVSNHDGRRAHPHPHPAQPNTEAQPVDRDAVDRSESVDADRVGAIVETLCRGAPEEVTLLAPEFTLAALDRLIASELDKRNEHVREQLDATAWSELENYVAWWVVHGYAVRAAENGGS